MISLKIHRRGPEHLVAACDSELLGRTLAEGKVRLTVHRSFYHAEEGDSEALRSRLQMATIANLVGERTVAVAVEMGLVEEDCVMIIDGVPHAQMARL